MHGRVRSEIRDRDVLADRLLTRAAPIRAATVRERSRIIRVRVLSKAPTTRYLTRYFAKRDNSSLYSLFIGPEPMRFDHHVPRRGKNFGGAWPLPKRAVEIPCGLGDVRDLANHAEPLSRRRCGPDLHWLCLG